jgi:hypothetical protein
MEERTKGTCPHGEFYLDEGCPQCIADRQARESGGTNIVKVKYAKKVVDLNTRVEHEEFDGRPYTYFTAEPLALGDVVKVPVTRRGGDFPEETQAKALVVEINVPESEIAAFRDKVKTIPSGSKRPPTQAPDLIPATEVELPPAETPPVAQVASLFDKPAHGPRRCDVEHLRDYPECFEECGKDECDGEPYTQDEGPTEGEHVEQLWDEARAAEIGWPPGLVTIEHKFGPPTASALFTLYQEAAGLLDYAKKRVIASNADLKPATDDLAIILTCRKAMEARKAEIVGPMRAELDQFYQAFNDLMAPVLEAEKVTKSKVAEFDQEQRRKAAEARRIEDEKARLAREEAALNGTGEITVPLETAPSPPPVPERTRTDMGTMYGRDNWKARVVDFKALPDEYKLPNEPLLNTYARTHKGEGSIPGVEFYDDRIVTVRTKN